MVSRRFSSFLLRLVFLFLALMDSLAYTHEATKKIIVAGENSVMAQGVSPSTLQKENFDAEKGKFGGRKMMEKKVMGKEEGMNGGGSSSSKISGRNMNVSKKPLGTSEEHMHDQNDTNMSKPKPLGSERLGTSTRSRTSVLQESSAGSFPKFQSQKLDDHQTTLKIENLMTKDYSGTGIPHSKPPINNYYPLHHQQHKVVP